MCLAAQPRAIFPHRNFKKWLGWSCDLANCKIWHHPVKPFFKQLEHNRVYNPSIPSYHHWFPSLPLLLQSKCHQTHHHPSHLTHKFLNIANSLILHLVTAPVKGGGSECRPPENSANDRIVQKWGVYHTPEEFVRKAAQAGHPRSLETCLPEVLKQALQSHKNQTSIARIKKRTVVMREWVKRADSLKSQEHELKSRFDSHAKHILSHKKIFCGSRCWKSASLQTWPSLVSYWKEQNWLARRTRQDCGQPSLFQQD